MGILIVMPRSSSAVLEANPHSNLSHGVPNVVVKVKIRLLLPRTGFDKSSLERLEQLFIKTVGNEKEIRREEFKKIVTSKNPFFTERVFQIFDKDNSGSISLQEFIDAIHQFAGQSPEDKIKFLFKVYDLDGTGNIIQFDTLMHPDI
uniref:Uncharacterized protein n=1 Tax=Anopheles albimanus TaxID=7167 RepID=A0A182F6C9_ANOAL